MDPGYASTAHSTELPVPAQPGPLAVLLPLPLTGPYDYLPATSETIVTGSYVEVPLGPRRLRGVVWGKGRGDVAAAKMKQIAACFDLPPMPESCRRFIDWVAAYTVSPPGAVLRMAISVPQAFDKPKPSLAFLHNPEPAKTAEGGAPKLTAARRRVLAIAADGFARTAAELAREAGCGVAVIHGLANAGLLEAVTRPETSIEQPDPAAGTRPTLSAEQEQAAGQLRANISAGYSVTLLDGVTGSGKTEVYFEAIATCLEHGRQALVLLPEISLTPQFLARFTRRFGAAPLEWHSDIPYAQKRQTWRAVARGEARVIVGARSALFLPFPALGLIVVDEEHEPAFKQEDGVVYQARDMAVARAFLGALPIVLVSATPSLESAINAETGRYQRVVLQARHGGRLPQIDLLDLRQDKPPPRRWLSPALCTAISETLARGEQAMLFLNRRGYAPLTLCRACGERLQCADCSAWLVEHRLAGRLICHHCGYTLRQPEHCPSCGAAGQFAACGPGAERIAEEALTLFPECQPMLLTSDTLQGPQSMRAAMQEIEAGTVNLLIGTQVMAKGHHFPLLTLVGVVDADLGLSGGDLRAAERTYQMLHQVSGRAGRSERPGRVILQSYMPEHPVMTALAAGDRDGFLALEAEQRRLFRQPPFTRLVALVVSGRDQDQVDATARALGHTAPSGDGLEVLGPAPAPLALLRGRHRRRLLLKASRTLPAQALVRGWLGRVNIPNAVRVQVDVDPHSFL